MVGRGGHFWDTFQGEVPVWEKELVVIVCKCFSLMGKEWLAKRQESVYTFPAPVSLTTILRASLAPWDGVSALYCPRFSCLNLVYMALSAWTDICLTGMKLDLQEFAVEGFKSGRCSPPFPHLKKGGREVSLGQGESRALTQGESWTTRGSPGGGDKCRFKPTSHWLAEPRLLLVKLRD